MQESADETGRIRSAYLLTLSRPATTAETDEALRFLANTVDPAASAWQPGQQKSTDMKLLSWPEHRFIDIGFGLPKLARRSR